MEWCARRDLNPQPSDPKSDALRSTQSSLIPYSLISCGVRRTFRPMLYPLLPLFSASLFYMGSTRRAVLDPQLEI
jgi:hypothetical protein